MAAGPHQAGIGAALAELWQDVPALPDYLAPAPADTGFFWFGPAGTITPCEVSRVANLRHCFSQVDGRRIDLQQFPALAGVPVLDVELAPGEILFLPMGWWHFVEALDIAVTV